MERLVASSDYWPDITVSGPDGLERTYSIGLEVTYDFDPVARRMAIAVRGLGHAADPANGWVSIFHQTPDPKIIGVFVGFIGTARQLAQQMGLSGNADFHVREYLEVMARKLSPFVEDCYVGRTCVPESVPTAVVLPDPTLTPEPDSVNKAETTTVPTSEPTKITQPPQANNVLVCIDRDVSTLFGKPEGTCTLEYRLFSEPTVFRALLVVNNGDKRKHVECLKKDVTSIIRFLSSDGVAMEVSSFLGSSSSNTVYLIGAVLKLALAMNTGLARDAAGAAFAPRPAVPQTPEPSPGDTQPVATIVLPKVDRFTVYNGGYFSVEVPTT